MLQHIDKHKALEIATRFFEQYHSKVYVTNAVMIDNIWEVTVSIGTMNTQTRRVGVDINNGKIRCYV